jgi:hypothetical protein
MSDDDDRAELVNATLAEARQLIGRLSFIHEPEPANVQRVEHLAPEPLRRAYESGHAEPEPKPEASPARGVGGGRYRARESGPKEVGTSTDVSTFALAAAQDPWQPWHDWLNAAIGAALDEERALQRAVQAEIVAHLQRTFDAELKDLRAELQAEIALRCAAVASELTLRTAEIEVSVLAAKTDVCKRMEQTILEMRKCLNAGDARAAENGANKVLN